MIGIEATVHLANRNWLSSSYPTRLKARLRGERQCFQFQGLRCTVAWLNGRPYMIEMEKVDP